MFFYMSWWFMFVHGMVVHVFFMSWLFMFFHVMVAHVFFMSWWFMFPKAPGFKNWMMLAVFLSQICLGLVGLVFF